MGLMSCLTPNPVLTRAISRNALAVLGRESPEVDWKPHTGCAFAFSQALGHVM